MYEYIRSAPPPQEVSASSYDKSCTRPWGLCVNNGVTRCNDYKYPHIQTTPQIHMYHKYYIHDVIEISLSIKHFSPTFGIQINVISKQNF